MIILFHCIYFMIKVSFRNYFNSEKKICNESQPMADSEETLVFEPPVYRQRYLAVKKVLEEDVNLDDDSIKVVDFGCAEVSFFVFLKNTLRVCHVLEVDIDSELLKENSFKVEPLMTDYLTLRSPLVVELLCGSIGDPDYRLSDVDAVVAIEIIEHLYPDTFEALSYNIFGYIKPKIAIFTTPNADFNVLFPNFKGFRHYDHKFEWSREQFEDWGINQTLRFPEYSVRFEGIGEGPEGTHDLGCCSQMAIFTRNKHETVLKLNPFESYGICTYQTYSIKFDCDKDKPNHYYNLVDKIEYPFNCDNRSSKDKLLHELIYFIHQNATIYSQFYNDCSNCVEIPILEIEMRFKECYETLDKLKSILENTAFLLKEHFEKGENSIWVVYEFGVESEHSEHELFDEFSNELNEVNLSSDSELDWDVKYVEDSSGAIENLIVA